MSRSPSWSALRPPEELRQDGLKYGHKACAQLDKEKMLNQQCDVKSPALTREPMASKRRTEYENGPSRWCGKRDAKQYQVSVIPLNKMREIDEQIQAKVGITLVVEVIIATTRKVFL